MSCETQISSTNLQVVREGNGEGQSNILLGKKLRKTAKHEKEGRISLVKLRGFLSCKTSSDSCSVGLTKPRSWLGSDVAANSSLRFHKSVDKNCFLTPWDHANKHTPRKNAEGGRERPEFNRTVGEEIVINIGGEGAIAAGMAIGGDLTPSNLHLQILSSSEESADPQN
jgi:hypothetical protein